jgi:putative SOS response-associated peptidase YedK
MCGRYLLVSPIETLRRLFGSVPGGVNLAPRWNIAPTTACLVLRRCADGTRRFDMLRWGLIPSWARDTGGAARMINARGETVAEKPAYRDSLRRRRCLVPADGFYEWPETGDDRRPVLFRRMDGAPFVFAGLWDTWRPPGGGDPLSSFTIVNTEARGAMRAYHHRVPIVLDALAQTTWLDPDADPMPLVRNAPFEDFAALRVGSRVNSVRNDDPDCAAPADRDEQPRDRVARRASDPRQESLF